MATELIMPQMGYDMQEGTVLRWLKGEGDAVANGEPIAEIETDKAVVEFESYAAGVLRRILVPAGTTVPVGEPIALVGAQDEIIATPDAPEDAAPEPDAAPPSAAIPMPPASVTVPVVETPAPEPEPEVAAPPPPPSLPLRASPVARRIADERGIDIAKVQGTGPGGRITKDDVLAYTEPEVVEEEVVEEVVAEVEAAPEPEAVVEDEQPVAEVEPEAAPEPEAVVVDEQPVAEVEPEAAPEPEAAVEEEQPVAEVEPEAAPEPEAAVADEQPVAEVEPEEAAPEVEAAVVDEEPVAEIETEVAPEPEAEAADDGMPLSRMRQQIARVTVRSKQEKPHFYVTSEVDMSEAMNLRQQINGALADEGVRVTVNDLIIKACADALKKHPKFNAFLDGDVIRPNDSVNIGIAMAVEEGLMMPAIMGCEGMTLKSIALASKDIADRAQNGTLRPDEYTGGTFGISNLGMFDVSTFVAIIQPPQSAILAVGTVAKKAVVRDDEIVIRQVMNATISADHRVVDGAEGAQFLIDVKQALEKPLSLLL